MRVAVTNTVVFDVPDATDVEAVKRALYTAHVLGLGRLFETVSGLVYIPVRMEQFEVREVRE